MSFTSEFEALLDERKRKAQEKIDLFNAYSQELAAKPAAKPQESGGNDLFDAGAFRDGYQFGDVTKVILGTAGDAVVGAGKGFFGFAEGLADTIGYGGYYVAKAFGASDADLEQYKAQVDSSYADALFGGAEKYLDDYSVLGRTSNAATQGIGQYAAMYGTGGFLGKTLGMGAKGASLATNGVMAASSFGSSVSEAFQGGATDAEALNYGVASAASEIAFEKLFGGLGKGMDIVGFNKGALPLDDMAAKAVSKFFKGQTGKNIAESLVKMGFEGLEEVGTGFTQAAAKKMTYLSEREFADILEDENLFEQFIVGSLVSGVAQAGDVHVANKTGRDFVTGFTQNEQAVIDKEMEKRLTKAREGGKKLSGKEKSNIYNQVVQDMEKGYISTETIESVLGKDALTQYDALSKEAEEFKTLYETKGGKLSEKQKDRLAELKEKNKANPYEELLKSQRAKISKDVSTLAQNDRLGESYREQARKNEKFQADVSKYSEAQRKTVQNAIDSGILNNTNRSHEFVDLIAKISADKGISFDFADNAKLKESGFALDGVLVNGFVNENGVTINIQSAKALNRVVGHEITHVLEGTQLYDALQSAVTEYAKTKKDYNRRLKELTDLYEGKNANVEQELVADLVGDYLFTDADFIKHLSTEHRNLFQKIYDEIKYLCKIVTAGTKEARQLEKVKKAFADAYRAETKNPTADGGVRYSLMAFEKDGRRFVEIDQDQDRFDGHSVDEYPGIAKEIIKEKFENKVIGIDNKMFVNGAGRSEFAYPSKPITDTNIYEAKMRSSAELDNLLDAGTNFRNEADGKDGHIHPDAVGGFDYFDTLFKIGNKYFEGTINIKNIKRGKLFTDVTQIKDVTQAIMSSYGKNPKSQFLRTSSMNSIRDPKQNVNSKNSLSKKDFSIAPPVGADVHGKDIGYDIAPPVPESVLRANKPRPKVGDPDYAPIRKDILQKAIQSTQSDESGIREQLRNNQDALNAMESVADIITPRSFAEMDLEEKKNWVIEKLRPTGYKVERNGFGIIDFAQKKLRAAFNYFKKGSAEEAAFEAMPSVLRKGVEISSRENHKGRKYSTVTFAAPVTINGQRGNMAVVVRQTEGNQYKVHRILSPDGSVFVLSEMQTEAESSTTRGVADNGSLASSKDSASNDIISKSGAIVNPEDAAKQARQGSKQDDGMPDALYGPWRMKDPLDIGVEKLYRMMLREQISEEDYVAQLVKADVLYQKRGETVESTLERVRTAYSRSSATDADNDQMTMPPETEAKMTRLTRKVLHKSRMETMREALEKEGYDLDELLREANRLSTFATVDNTPQRVIEKTFGFEAGQIINDLTVNRVALNESEGIQWLNKRVEAIRNLSKKYDIKPGSKESRAAQIYGEGFWVNEAGEYITYGDKELAADFPDVNKQEHIKKLAKDPEVRKMYDETLEAINAARVRNGYPPIPKREDYFLHFRAMDDPFSRLGVPFNPNNIKAKDLPTDLNGVTADLKPGKPFFASEMKRKGDRTTYDLLGGLERYMNSAKNQIYHVDDIQTLRAFRNYIADMFGQKNGLSDLDSLSPKEQEIRIKEVYNGHLSTFAKFLNEEANILAGKTALFDRGIEGVLGRRAIQFLHEVNGQVGKNYVGWNISSAGTNVLPIVEATAKLPKVDMLRAFVQTASNKFRNDGFVESDPALIRRRGADQFAKTFWQKISDPGYVLMSAVDNLSSEVIVRAKYNELTRKQKMDSQQAHIRAGEWASRLMGDRSLGQMPQLYNSKTLGLITKFQLEVRNYLDSALYDTIQEAKAENTSSAKKAAKITSTMVQLAVFQHLFGKAFEAIAGYNPAFDIVENLIKLFGFDDDEESEDTFGDNLEQAFLGIWEDLPYTSTFTGGRIPIGSALPIKEFITGKDSYGNEKGWLETIGEALPYYLLPGGYGQLKKTAGGLDMYLGDHPVAGSYTKSGNLRFPVEDTFGNKLQAGLFGQYANENARDYFDNGRSPLKTRQIHAFMCADMPIQEYWAYREGLSSIEADKDADGNTINGSKKEKVVKYIENLNVSDDAKHILLKYEYPSDDTYNFEIIDYLNSRTDISYTEMKSILDELGFKVDTKGNITWD